MKAIRPESRRSRISGQLDDRPIPRAASFRPFASAMPTACNPTGDLQPLPEVQKTSYTAASATRCGSLPSATRADRRVPRQRCRQGRLAAAGRPRQDTREAPGQHRPASWNEPKQSSLKRLGGNHRIPAGSSWVRSTGPANIRLLGMTLAVSNRRRLHLSRRHRCRLGRAHHRRRHGGRDRDPPKPDPARRRDHHLRTSLLSPARTGTGMPTPSAYWPSAYRGGSAGAAVLPRPAWAPRVSRSELMPPQGEVGNTSYTSLPFQSQVYTLCFNCSPDLEPAELFFDANPKSVFSDPAKMAQTRQDVTGKEKDSVVPSAGIQRWEATLRRILPQGRPRREPDWAGADRHKGSSTGCRNLTAWRADRRPSALSRHGGRRRQRRLRRLSRLGAAGATSHP